MESLVGFSLYSGVPEQNLAAAQAAQRNALARFNHLEKRTINVGNSQLDVWGHKNARDRIHILPDGSVLALIGSPLGDVSWQAVSENLQRAPSVREFELPWEGRVILLRVSADGKCWTMWNDWLGSIPVYHATPGESRLASSLEPVVVSGAGYTPKDFFLPGLVSLMINGHFISDWTLYQGMHTVLPDSVAEWDERGYRAQQVWSVLPTQDRWTTGYDALVDEMCELSYSAIATVLRTQPSWILPLSSGMDSRLIAGVGTKAGVNLYAYAWGEAHTTDVVYSREVAKTLGLPWKHIAIDKDFLVKYTKDWASWFGSSLHFHGMYLMSFLDALNAEPDGPVISGFVGDTLAGDIVSELTHVHADLKSYQVGSEWYVFWTADEIRSVFGKAFDEALEANAEEIRNLITRVPGEQFQQLQFLELWGRQRLFIPYQSTLCDYWRGVGTPYINRAYARFCLSLPRAVLDDRHLLGDVFRRYYGPLAVIPGTYAKDPFILTGRYLALRRLAEKLPQSLHYGPLRGFGNVQIRLDVDCIQALGKSALWPLFESLDKMAQWLDVRQLEQDYQTILKSKEDIRPLRRLQAAQTLAYRLNLEGGKT